MKEEKQTNTYTKEKLGKPTAGVFGSGRFGEARFGRRRTTPNKEALPANSQTKEALPSKIT